MGLEIVALVVLLLAIVGCVGFSDLELGWPAPLR